MNYWKQTIAVTQWEFSRFFKPKNEAIGIVVMIITSTVFYLGGKYAFSNKGSGDASDKMEISVLHIDDALTGTLQARYTITPIAPKDKTGFLERIMREKNGVLLEQDLGTFKVYAYKHTGATDELKTRLGEYHKQRQMQKIGLTPDELNSIMSPPTILESFQHTDHSKHRRILSYFFAGLMVVAVFLSFAYQFTAITGEKQLRITEQIVSAISPQVWMDGKILGITLTGLASIVTYSIVSVIAGVLYYQFTGRPLTGMLAYLHVPSILTYLPFALAGILIWNSLLAAVASVITDPNTSGKSSLMMLPVLFVAASFMVTRDPDNSFSIFLSWFPLTSATSMPMRSAIADVATWEIAGSFIVLLLTFYLLRKLAAKIFRVSILLSGKEPSWKEVYRMSKMS